MFSLMLHKLNHKKWMVLCLMIGNILLVSVAASYPLYRVSSFQKMLTREFEDYEEEKNRFPAIFEVSCSSMKGSTQTSPSGVEEAAFAAAETLPVEISESVVEYRLGSQKVTPSVVRDGEEEKKITLAAISDMQQHVELLYGRFPEDTPDAKGFLEVMVSDEAMISQDILLDDEYTYTTTKLMDGELLKLKVVGIFHALDETEVYWQTVTDDVGKMVYTSREAFRTCFLGKGVEENYSLSGTWSFIWDYNKLEITQVSDLTRAMNRLDRDETLKGKIEDSGYRQILSEYSSKAKRIEATLLILQVPVLLLLCAFLYMIAGQMLQMERNEISLLRSRGASKRQVFCLYLMQSFFLGLISLLAGIPLAVLFCKLLGSSTAFLEFSAAGSLTVRFTPDIIPYTAGAVLLSVIMTTIPVLSYSGLSIVNLKQSRSRQKKPFWKKLYLDVVLLAVSLYGFYSFRRTSGQVVKDVLEGNSLDPLLYISFSLFILGAGLLCARLQPLLLKGFFRLFKNHMKPAGYASVLGTIRTGAKQDFIILFLILTVSIGISDTTIARTIVLNAVNNTRHIVGADIVVREKWTDNRASRARNPELELEYTEPDFDKYNTIPGVSCATPVVMVDKGNVSAKSKIKTSIMGIRAQGFYTVSYMEDDLLPYTYAEYLNVLATDPQAVLVSENFMIKQGYQLGDIISYENDDGAKAMGLIYGFFPYWPTYEPQSYTVNSDGNVEEEDNYLIVANQTYLKEQWGAYPYEVWLQTNDGGQGFYEWVAEHPELQFTRIEDMTDKEEAIIHETMFQGTNGILSMSFIVILLLCCVGYLIYWIMSIRSRELLFGVLRAMGMRKSEINWMLIVEQICSGLYAIVCGGGIGVLASRMFVPMIQQAYAASEQVLPLRLITKAGDMLQLFAVIAVMLCVCLVVLGRIIAKMNISSALKLGED